MEDHSTRDTIWGVVLFLGLMWFISNACQPRPVYYYGPYSAEDAYQQRAQHAEAMEEQSNRYGR